MDTIGVDIGVSLGFFRLGRLVSSGNSAVVVDWVRELRARVDAHDDPQELQDALLAAYSELPTSELTELMALAFELAHLQGRERVALEGGRG